MRWWKKASPAEDIEIQLTLADKISRLVIRTSSAAELAQKTVMELSPLMSIDWAALALVDEPAKKADVAVLLGDGGSGQRNAIPLADTPFAWVVENKQALLEPDLKRERHFPLAILGEDVATVVHMPLFYQGEVFGILSVGSSESDAYRDSQLRLLRHAVVHLGISLKSALLLEQNLRTETSLKNLNELLDIITSGLDLPAVFPQFARRLKAIVPFDRLSLVHIEGNTLRTVASFCEEDSYAGTDETWQVSDSAIPWMQEHGEISIAEDLESKKQFPMDDVRLREGFRGEIRVPFFSHGALFASLELASSRPYHLEGETAFLKQLAHYVATPVESYLLYAYERQRLDWLAALAHHMRNPLSPIISSSRLLVGELDKQGEGTLTRLAQNISAGAEKLSRNVKLFWDLSEVESSSFSLELEPVDPGPVLSEVAGEALAETEARDQSLVVELPETLPRIDADPSRMKQVLRVLLNSAIQASPEGGRVVLQAREGKVIALPMPPGTDIGQPPRLIIEVADSGQGFSPEEKERLLQPYRLSEADRRDFPELALNLAVSRRIIELHGGRLWLESEPGKGSTFGLSLPVAQDRV